MNFQLPAAELRPIVREVINEVLSEMDGSLPSANGRLAYSEPEAAALLGLPTHRLRDARLRGEIRARKVGRAYRYARTELVRFIQDFAG